MAIIAKLKSGVKYISAVIVAGGVAFIALSPADTVVIHPDRLNIQSFEIYQYHYIVRDLRADVVDGGSVMIDSRIRIPTDIDTGFEGVNVFLEEGIVSRVEQNGVGISATSADMVKIENALSVIVLELNK